MTSLFDKVFTQVRGALHDTIDANSNPGTTARQLIRDLEDKIATAERGLAEAMGNLIELEGRRDTAKEGYDKYDDYAVKAMAQGNESLAKDALVERAKFESSMKGYQDEVDHFKPQVDALEANVTALRAKKEQLQRDGEMLEAQSNAAKAQDKVATALSGVGDTSSIDAQFAEIKRRTEKTAAAAQAKTEIANLRKPAEDKFKALDAAAPSSIADELAKLKERVGK